MMPSEELRKLLDQQRYGEFVSELKKLNEADCSISPDSTLETLRMQLRKATDYFSYSVAGQLCECLSIARNKTVENYNLFDSSKNWEHGPYWALDAIKYFQQQENRDYLLDSTEKKVAIIVKEGGAVARLKLDLVKGAPDMDPVFFPSAQTNSFVEVDQEAKKSLYNGYYAAIDSLKRDSDVNQPKPRGVNFRWDIRRMDGLEIPGLAGGSLGGEFSILFYRLLQDHFNSAKSLKSGEG